MVLLNDHYVPDPVLSPLVLEAGAILIPIFQMQKLRHRQSKSIAQGCTAGEWQSSYRACSEHRTASAAYLDQRNIPKNVRQTLNDDGHYDNHLLSL